jgi:hypothetical protein
MATQISQFSKCIQRKMIKSFSEPNGGNVRVLPALLHHSACSCRLTWPDARRRLGAA